MRSEAGLAESVGIAALPDELSQIASALERDQLFRRTFSQLPIEFKHVDAEGLVAPQRAINLEHVRLLDEFLSDAPSAETVARLCLEGGPRPTQVGQLQPAGNVAVFSSISSDFRFLGGFVKPITQSDIDSALGGGMPVAAVLLLVGYGGGAVNVLAARGRLILNNGFHRVYALIRRGITRIPVVVQRVNDPDLEFPDVVAGLPKDYLLNSPRPAVMKDFLDERLLRALRTKAKTRTVKIGWGVEQFDVPDMGQ